MNRRRIALVAAVVWLACGRAAAAAESHTSPDPTAASGTITAIDLDELTMTIADAKNVPTTVLLDGANTLVSGVGHEERLRHLRVGQQVRVSGRYMAYVGRLMAKAVAVTQEPPRPPEPAAPPASPEEPKKAAAAPKKNAKPVAAQRKKPSVLRSDVPSPPTGGL